MAQDECRKYYIDFLECYKNYKCLWDTSHPFYTHKKSRNDAYNELLKIYKKIKGGVSVTDLKRKIYMMRTSYNREAKKLKCGSLTTGSRTSKNVPTLWYYNHLSFLSKEGTINKDRRDAKKEIKSEVGEDVNHEEANSKEQVRSAVFSKAVTSTTTADSTPAKAGIATTEVTEERTLEIALDLLNSEQDQWDLMGCSSGCWVLFSRSSPRS